MSNEDEEIISMLMEERKIDKDTATEFYLSIMVSEDTTGKGLKGRGSAGEGMGDTGDSTQLFSIDIFVRCEACRGFGVQPFLCYLAGY